MNGTRKSSSLPSWVAAAVGLGALGYGGYVAATWSRYGRRSAKNAISDDLMDRFMRDCEVSDHHARRVRAPAAITFAAACDSELGESPIVEAIFKVRELIFGRPGRQVVATGGLVEEIKSFGWGVLAEVPDREIVFGAVTQPWKSDVKFRAVPPAEFAAFDEPGYVKIIWMLRVHPLGASRSIVRTETRVTTTDADARAKFRWYWSFLSPGIKIIRLVMLEQIKASAEHRFAGQQAAPCHNESPVGA
jgi:hypothetical protein